MALSTDHQAIGAALGRVPSGAGILTAAHAGRRTGMLASWFQQVSFEPPMLALALRRARPICELIEASGALLLHVLTPDECSRMFKHFGKGFSLEDEAFAGLTVADTDFGPLIEGMSIALAGRVRARSAAGDHELLLAEVVAGRGGIAHAPYVHIRKTGHSY